MSEFRTDKKGHCCLFCQHSVICQIIWHLFPVIYLVIVVRNNKKKGYPIEHQVADCDNDTTFPEVDDQLFSHSSPIQSNPFVSSWTGPPSLPSRITPATNSFQNTDICCRKFTVTDTTAFCCVISQFDNNCHNSYRYCCSKCLNSSYVSNRSVRNRTNIFAY